MKIRNCKCKAGESMLFFHLLMENGNENHTPRATGKVMHTNEIKSK